MSLVICSNDNVENRESHEGEGGTQMPYQFTNYITTPSVIPANSEVAVQSVKFNKNPMYHTSPSSNRMYMWFGEPLNVDTTTPAYLKVEDTTSSNMMGWISNPYPQTLNVDDFAKMVQDSFNGEKVWTDRAGVVKSGGFLYHPNIQGKCKSWAKREDKTGIFEGIDIQFDQREGGNTGTYGKPLNNLPTATSDWEVIDTRNNFTITNPLDVLTFTATEDTSCWGAIKNAPLSQTGGRFDVDVSGISVDAPFGGATIGLSRGVDSQLTGSRRVEPLYYAGNQGNFLDYKVRLEPDGAGDLDICVYHAVVDQNNKSQIAMEEVEYWGTWGHSAQTTKQKITADVITAFSFYVEGEAVGITCTKGAIADTPLVQTGYWAGVGKKNHFKPTAITTWSLYGNIILHKKDDFVVINKWGGITDIPNWTYMGENKDWWASQIKWGKEDVYAQGVDTRERPFDTESSKIKSMRTLNLSYGVAYNFVMVLGQSNVYYKSVGANAIRSFGFKGNSVVVENPDHIAGNKITFKSNATPDIVAVSGDNSMFVRLDNFTMQSFNAMKHSPSHMIYHIPNFTNNGTDRGAMYFEPSEKTYIKLNNPSPITLNSFDISIVYKDERFAEGLVGSSVVVLHFRQNKDLKK